MDINEVSKIVEDKKSGILKESTIPDFMVFGESDYDVTEKVFIVDGSNTVDGNAKFFISEQYIKDEPYERIRQDIMREYEVHNRMFDSIWQGSDEESIANIITYMNYNKSNGELAESLHHHLTNNDFNINSKRLPFIKKRVSENVKNFRKFKSYTPQQTYLDEGMIKVPPKTLSIIKEILDMIIYQISINCVSDQPSYELMMDALHTLKIDIPLAKKWSSELMGKDISYDNQYGVVGSVDLKVDDIPYDIDVDSVPLTISFDGNLGVEGFSHNINGAQVVAIDVSRILTLYNNSNIIDNPVLFADKDFIEKIKSIRGMITSTVIHELMHFIQHVVFVKREYDAGSTKPKSIEKNDGDDFDSYITSQVEFDPTINDLTHTFRHLVGSIEDYTGNEIDTDVQRELLKKYLASGYKDDVPDYFKNNDTALMNVIKKVFSPPHFVELIKRDHPKKYPVMVKKMYSELF